MIRIAGVRKKYFTQSVGFEPTPRSQRESDFQSDALTTRPRLLITIQIIHHDSVQRYCENTFVAVPRCTLHQGPDMLWPHYILFCLLRFTAAAKEENCVSVCKSNLSSMQQEKEYFLHNLPSVMCITKIIDPVQPFLDQGTSRCSRSNMSVTMRTSLSPVT